MAVNRLTRYAWAAGAGLLILALAFLTVLANAVTLVVTLVILAGIARQVIAFETNASFRVLIFQLA